MIFVGYKTVDVASFWENVTIELKPMASDEESPLKKSMIEILTILKKPYINSNTMAPSSNIQGLGFKPLFVETT